MEDNFTFEELHNFHISLWTELSKSNIQSKSEIVDKLQLPKTKNDCYACAYDDIFIHNNNTKLCEMCPIIWKNDNGDECDCIDEGTYFFLWNNSTTIDEKKKYAKCMSEMEWVKKELPI